MQWFLLASVPSKPLRATGIRAKQQARGLSNHTQLQATASMGPVAYSIWVMPEGTVAEEYQDNITKLSKKHNGPVFQPHVTLLAGTQQTEHDAIQRAEALAHALKPQEIELRELSFGSTFHQCIYIRCKQQLELMEAATASQAAFGEPPTSFTPHLSLLYSDVPESERMQIVSDVAAERAPNTSWPAFRMDRIHLWSTETDDRSLSSWTLVQSFELQK